MRALLLVLGALLALPAGAGEDRSGDPLAIELQEIEVPPASLHRRARQLGAWRMTAAHPEFGGISAMLIEGGRLTLATDRGRWIFGRLTFETAPVLSGTVTRPMTGADGSRLSGRDADAEGLARAPDGTLLLSFEQDHRVMALTGPHLSAPRRPGGWAALARNGGIEGLASMPGVLIAIAEEPLDGRVLYWLLTEDGAERGAIPQRSRHHITGADAHGGRLYLVARHWTPTTGVSIRLLDMPLGADGHPEPELLAELAAWENDSGIDNMEAIAVEPAGEGRLRVWLLSDDNFNTPQRTILVALEVETAPR